MGSHETENPARPSRKRPTTSKEYEEQETQPSTPTSVCQWNPWRIIREARCDVPTRVLEFRKRKVITEALHRAHVALQQYAKQRSYKLGTNDFQNAIKSAGDIQDRDRKAMLKADIQRRLCRYWKKKSTSYPIAFMKKWSQGREEWVEFDLFKHPHTLQSLSLC